MLILLIIVLLLSFGGFKLYKYIKHERLKAAHRADIYNKQGQVRVLTWGLLAPYGYVSSNIIAARYGIQYEMIGTCTIDNVKADSAKLHNELAEEILEKKLGANWRVQMDREIDEENVRISTVIQLVGRQPYILALKADTAKKNEVLDYDVQPIGKSHEYLVQCFSSKYLGEKEVRTNYFNLRVDYNTKEIAILDKKASVTE